MAGFLIRPLGAVLWGYIGDRYGRKRAYPFMILFMSIATGTIAFIPPYHSIGIYASLLLLFCRLLQGVCIAGEYSGAITYSLEHCKEEFVDTEGELSQQQRFLAAYVVASRALFSLTLLFQIGHGEFHFFWGFSMGLSVILLGVIFQKALFLKNLKEL